MTSSALQFPFLADLIPDIAQRCNQPMDEQGQLTWDNPSEFLRACDAEYLQDFYAVSRIAKGFDYAISNVAVTQGLTRVLLPSDLRVLRYIWVVDSAGNNVRRLMVGNEEHRGEHDYEAIFVRNFRFGLPGLDQRSILELMRPAPQAMTLRVVYGWQPIQLMHGCVQDSGLSSTKIGDHESADNSSYLGQLVYLYRGPGAGQAETVASYVGATRTMTMSTPWAVAPTNQTCYTTRPFLPREARNAFVAGVCLRLARKVDKAQKQEWLEEKAECFRSMQDDLFLADRQAPDTTRDDMPGTHGDPIYDWPFGGWAC